MQGKNLGAGAAGADAEPMEKCTLDGLLIG